MRERDRERRTDRDRETRTERETERDRERGIIRGGDKYGLQCLLRHKRTYSSPCFFFICKYTCVYLYAYNIYIYIYIHAFKYTYEHRERERGEAFGFKMRMSHVVFVSVLTLKGITVPIPRQTASAVYLPNNCFKTRVVLILCYYNKYSC